MFWLVVAVIGFLVLTAVVITLGTFSTSRYEREKGQRGGSPPPGRQALGLPGTA